MTKTIEQITEQKRRIVQKAIEKIEKQDGCNSYVGTFEGEDFLILSSWDDLNMIEKIIHCNIDSLIEYGFYEEYNETTCCGKIVRTSPDSYSWSPEFYILECELVCKDCLSFEKLITDIENNPSKCNQLFKNEKFVEYGYFKLNDEDYENGLHQGQNDDPKKIFDELENEYNSIVFSINEVSQFYIKFDVWVKNN